MKEITFKQLAFHPESWRFSKLSTVVLKKDDGTYVIKLKAGKNWKGENVSEGWDCFELDATGLITAAPLGYVNRFFNKKVRIIDIEKAVYV